MGVKFCKNMGYQEQIVTKPSGLIIATYHKIIVANNSKNITQTKVPINHRAIIP